MSTPDLDDTLPAENLQRRTRAVPDDDATTTTGQGLPRDLVQRAARRLSIASIACAAVFAVVFFTMNFAPPSGIDTMTLSNVVAAATVLMSLVVFVVAGSKVEPERLLNYGLVYQVAGAFGIALAENLATYQPTGTVRGVSWVCLWITLFPLVVPSTPRKTFWISLTCAAMGPAAIFASSAAGMALPSPAAFVYLVTPNFAAAGLAVLLSRVIHQLGTDVRKARQMGAYQLIELLGRGGMGEVWRAKHRLLAQPAAIKLVSPEALGGTRGDTTTILKRFQREARATAMLNSPHTIQIYDFGRTADGTLYYVMELLDGVDLETLIQEWGPIPEARAAFMLRQLCESLGEAHDSGLIHRDIKPANVYVCKLGSHYDFVKVLDFGIVGIQSELSRGQTKLTKENIVTGTPAYMAPEMATGSHEPDARLDIYALGCVAYWLVTGKLVFEGSTPVQIVYAHVDKKPVPPTKRADIALSESFEQLILDCLAKEPKDRPASAAEVMRRLEVLNFEHPWSEQRANEWWDSRPLRSRVAPATTRRPHDTVVPLR